MQLLRKVSFLVLMSILGGASSFAQFLSGIEGTVQDQTGAAIPAATVTITDTRLGVTRTVTSSQNGYFRIDSIAASTYTVQVQASGFTSWNQNDLVLQPGEIRTLRLSSLWERQRRTSQSSPQRNRSTW
jgi:hypothetical protein